VVPDRADGGTVPAPDTAVLAVTVPGDLHPCVPLTDGTDPDTDAVLLVTGYTKVRVGEAEPDAARTTFVDPIGLGRRSTVQARGRASLPPD
jgi:hypothetical protein